MSVDAWVWVQGFAAAALGNTALGFLTKMLIERSMDRRADRERAEIAHMYEVKKAEIEVTLREAEARRTVTFEALHLKRLDATESVYSALLATQQTFGNWMNPWQSSPVAGTNDYGLHRAAMEQQAQERAKAAQHALSELVTCAMHRRIYFDSATAQKVDAVIKEFDDVRERYLQFGVDWDVGSDRAEQTRQRVEAWRRLNHSIQMLITELEQTFRGLIGVD